MVLLTASVGAQTKPSYKEARAIYDQFSPTISQTMLWHKKPLQERIAALKSANVLVTEAEKLFGTGMDSDGRACVDAANWHRSYVMDLNDMALVADGRSQLRHELALFTPMSHGVQFGEYKARCFEYVESLDTPQKKK